MLLPRLADHDPQLALAGVDAGVELVAGLFSNLVEASFEVVFVQRAFELEGDGEDVADFGVAGGEGAEEDGDFEVPGALRRELFAPQSPAFEAGLSELLGYPALEADAFGPVLPATLT